MTYVPKPDIEGINSPRAEDHRPFRDVVILLLGFFAIFIFCFLTLTVAADWAITKISIKSELSLFGSMWDRWDGFDKDGKPRTSPNFDRFVAGILKHVDIPVKVSVMCEETPNAFALPGGRIFLTSGLLTSLKSENGLAFVLGHEIGHVLHRDHLRGIARSLSFGIAAGVLGFQTVGGFDSLNAFLQRAYDRHQETSADSYGLELLNKVYGHTHGAEELFAILAAKESKLERAVARIAYTHPPSKDRLRRIEATQIEPKRELVDWATDFHCPNKL